VIKQIFLPLVAVGIFIVLVGLYTKNPGIIKTKTLTIGSKSISVEIAKTAETRAKGLSGRSTLSEDSGMLFVFDTQDVTPIFWMKEMLIPIDIIWINDDRVVKIDKNVSPPEANTPDAKLPTYSAGGPIDYVLEVSSGLSDKNGIKIADPVVLPTF
jgi:uncharacterized protein